MSEERIITFNGDVNEMSALDAIMKLLYLDSESKTEPIQMYLNSNGGNIIHGLAIYDTIKYISAPVYITCTGLAASMGAFLLSCGAKGHRAALKHARILIHQPLISSQSTYVQKENDIKRLAEGLLKDRQLLEQIMADNSGQSLANMHAACERDNWLSAEEAKEFGLIDEVI